MYYLDELSVGLTAMHAVPGTVVQRRHLSTKCSTWQRKIVAV